ncbi:MAG: DUF861 domain-containing protein [Gammaproteobacteria bacterium]|jgi:uncharacterized cupin superfamily protein|nr:DUF861 domain-containing protein [Gammaproteobacteria bacterium]
MIRYVTQFLSLFIKRSTFTIAILMLFLTSEPMLVEAGEVASVPFKVDRETMSGTGLGEFAPWPDSMILKGSSKHTLSEVFSGEIVIGVYQTEAIKLAITSPWPFDEMILVLSGELQLQFTGEDAAKKFVTGDVVIVPKGYTGTWEMLGDYRELYVIEKQAFLNSQEPGGLLGE